MNASEATKQLVVEVRQMMAMMSGKLDKVLVSRGRPPPALLSPAPLLLCCAPRPAENLLCRAPAFPNLSYC